MLKQSFFLSFPFFLSLASPVQCQQNQVTQALAVKGKLLSSIQDWKRWKKSGIGSVALQLPTWNLEHYFFFSGIWADSALIYLFNNTVSPLCLALSANVMVRSALLFFFSLELFFSSGFCQGSYLPIWCYHQIAFVDRFVPKPQFPDFFEFFFQIQVNLPFISTLRVSVIVWTHTWAMNAGHIWVVYAYHDILAAGRKPG